MSGSDSFAVLLRNEISLDESPPSAAHPSFPEWQAVEEGRISESRLLELYARAYGLEILSDLEGNEVCDEFLSTVPIDMAREHGLLGLTATARTMDLAVSNPHKVNAIDDVSRLTGLKTVLKLAPREAILAAINRAYERNTTIVDEVVEKWDTAGLDGEFDRIDTQEDLLDMAHRAPVIKLVNSILFEAIRHNASDIHIQAGEHGVQVRLRVDGVLYDRTCLPMFLLGPVVSRIKIMARMNVSERRLAQDGRCTARIGNRVVDLRVSSIPCSAGERVVLRLLDKTSKILDLKQLGMNPETLVKYDQMLHSSHGIILITGPTGSGKTTTLYASLQRLNSKEKNVLTLEDPIEYQLEGISQTQVNTKKGMTFASGLRHVLRQDPDIIMVGEIRDEETARMAVQSSLTGHLVFSTLHTNDAPSAIARMLDLGVEPYLVASSLLGVLAQRLVRKLCPQCRQGYQPDDSELSRISQANKHSAESTRLYRQTGCAECFQRGFIGRTGIYELLNVNGSLRTLIGNRAETNQLKVAAAAVGFTSLRKEGIRKALEGLTTLSEVMRVTQQEEV